uniref:Uncharacterized protein n=1 Tax=Megaselia scalaris TaxID=36166 RepID=T1H4B5_MEGSC
MSANSTKVLYISMRGANIDSDRYLVKAGLAQISKPVGNSARKQGWALSNKNSDLTTNKEEILMQLEDFYKELLNGNEIEHPLKEIMPRSSKIELKNYRGIIDGLMLPYKILVSIISKG